MDPCCKVFSHCPKCQVERGITLQKIKDQSQDDINTDYYRDMWIASKKCYCGITQPRINCVECFISFPSCTRCSEEKRLELFDEAYRDLDKYQRKLFEETWKLHKEFTGRERCKGKDCSFISELDKDYCERCLKIYV
jgi:hypothetical protein